MMATCNASNINSNGVRISKIAGRYLIFDSDAIALLRRQENTNGTLVGTTPQQPTQNIFLALPVELRPEEAHTLVRKASAHIVDDVAAHRAALASTNTEARMIYIDSLRKSKQAAQHAFAERLALKTATVASRQEESVVGIADVCSSKGIANNALGSDINTSPHHDQKGSNVGNLALTPVSSNFLLPRRILEPLNMQGESNMALCRFLQGRGNYMTPGLRFGAQYSVYPGDPLRFHAHFMANEYEWDEQIPILDIVGGGRLATAVKKAFLIGGQQTTCTSSPEGLVRTYSIEWAAM